MSDEIITLDVRDYVATITLNRGPVNAMNSEMRNRFVAILDEVNERDDIRAAVLCSSQKVFCAGADLRDRPDGRPGTFGAHNRVTRECFNAIVECSKPIVAAVNGAALGMGFAIAAFSDVVVASEQASFGMPEIDVGLAGGAAMLKTVLGRGNMRMMFLTGARFSGAEMYRMGVVNILVAPDQVHAEAQRLAAVIASKAPLAVAYAKRSCNMADLMPTRDAYRFEQDFTVALSKTEDAVEARTAMLEKRPPVYRGR
ncbi:enoyl-CoA hydratase/isomerase family protein [Falsigemmobacter intermedius]|uniref:Enoyl-CoA hydratase/isomerase family protein n=1 Tax=Falsigemmobacter intermedius TaxID=1553448 RepID=A0A444MBV8_9RHOB|nr:enoyl-CoA hydratase/isomerase family protein [Falsigemmobacter intermedius]RWY41473.1 enoyl-CoA hydratase/isomerase family protein [Falsigemmobacter intermedius]